MLVRAATGGNCFFSAREDTQEYLHLFDELTVPERRNLPLKLKDAELELAVIPPGEFMMGTSREELAQLQIAPRYAHREYPPRLIEIVTPFAVAPRLVTRGEFRQFVDETGHQPAHWCEVFHNNECVFDESLWWENPGFEQTDEHPLVSISWGDAQAYLNWLSSRHEKRYRLLSEAEFEYAARAGTTSPWFWNTPEEQALYANGADLSSLDREDTFALSQTYGRPIEPANCRSGFCFTSPVGTFKPNPYGLYDILGNVWEWVEDCFDEDVMPTTQAPQRWEGCEFRTIRGGSWAMEPAFLRCAARQRDHWWHNDRDIGFRVARDLDLAETSRLVELTAP